MNKKSIIGFVLGAVSVLGLMGLVANAAPCTPPTGGGTGICSVATSSVGQVFYVSSSSPYTIGLETSSGGGVATTSVFSAGYLPVVSSSLALTNSNIYQSSTQTLIGSNGVSDYLGNVNTAGTLGMEYQDYLNATTTLAFGTASTSIQISTTTGLFSNGMVMINGQEMASYSSVTNAGTSSTLNGMQRGLFGTPQQTALGAAVYAVPYVLTNDSSTVPEISVMCKTDILCYMGIKEIPSTNEFINANNLQATTLGVTGVSTLNGISNTGNVTTTSETVTGNTTIGGTLNVTSTATFQATSTFNGNVSTTIAANSFVATNGQGILVATGTPSGGITASTCSVGSYISGISATGTLSCALGNYYYNDPNPAASSQGVASANDPTLWGISTPPPLQADSINIGVATFDASTTDLYDIGIYQNNAGSSTFNLVADVGATSSWTVGTGAKTLKFSQGLVTFDPTKKYYFGFVGPSTTLKLDGGQSVWTFLNGAAKSAITANTSLPATTTQSSDSWTWAGQPAFSLFNSSIL